MTDIKRMWLAEAARGLGLGRRLLADARAARRGTPARARVRLETSDLLVEAVALYRSAGYREVPAFNDEPFADHWFEKRLVGRSPRGERTVSHTLADGGGLAAVRAMATSVVAGRDLTKRYGEGDAAVNALRGVSLEIAPGTFTAIMGPSGSGKSTLMHVLAGLDRPTEGTVDIAGTEIGKLDDGDLTRLRRDKIGFVFQAFNLVPVLTAEENVRLPLTLAGRDDAGGRVDAAARGGRADRPPHPPPRRAVGRPAAARRGGARARLRARGDLRRRADRQPRLDDLGRDPRAAAPRGRRVRPGRRHGHARGRPPRRSPTA